MGCYISPIDTSTIEDVAAAIRVQPYRAKILVAGEFNSNLVEPEGTPQGEAIADKLVVAGLLEMGLNFLLQSKPWFHYRFMWNM